MNRSRGMLVPLLPLALVFSSVATVSAIILIVVVSLLTLFAVVGVSFTYYADVRAVPMPSADVGACDVVISVLDERGDILDTRQFLTSPRGKWSHFSIEAAPSRVGPSPSGPR